MPQAIAGEETGGAYSYTVKATVKEVQDYYDREMPKVGWQPFAVGTGKNNNLILIYQKDGKTASVAIIAQGDVTYVLLVKE